MWQTVVLRADYHRPEQGVRLSQQRRRPRQYGCEFWYSASSWWDMNVDLLLPSGTSVSCQSSLSPPAPDSKTVTIFCPTVALDAMPACDTTMTIELRPRSSTYSDGNNSQALCAGTGGRQITLSVPVVCPTSCGYVSNYGSCSVLGQTCDYTTMGWGGAGGTTVSLPCSCEWNESLDELAWSCAVP